MAYSQSVSTDKLIIMTNAAKEMLANHPDLSKRIKTLSVKWNEVGDVAVPDILIEFHETKPGINLGKE